MAQTPNSPPETRFDNRCARPGRQHEFRTTMLCLFPGTAHLVTHVIRPSTRRQRPVHPGAQRIIGRDARTSSQRTLLQKPPGLGHGVEHHNVNHGQPRNERKAELPV